jgi:uncharacterized protein
MTHLKSKIHCPTCGKKDTWKMDNESRPFCSHRCKLIDLGEWAEGAHRIPGEKVDLDENKNDTEN